MLYLVRHAHAIDGEVDPARPLSERGQKQVAALARFLGPSGAFRPEEMWHSPLVRSRETAHSLALLLKMPLPLREMPDLRPEDDPAATMRRLRLVRRPLAIVGHEPHLSALASLLVTGETEPPAFVFKKCTALMLEPNGDAWLVRWQISPELLA
ncbi:MAG TPA: histidine phosphatase family protein [Opitutaceae bacterium]|nr:histidine phosphatase family protein [Opitutaceae bacterium]